MATLLGGGFFYQWWFMKHCGFTELAFKKKLGLVAPATEEEIVVVAEVMPVMFADAHYADVEPLPAYNAEFDHDADGGAVAVEAVVV
ncbi:hypothetical protein TeGR_g10009 [Tetraparma gracilis]|uniref:Uncharacterized protein n=1 Tax=Tetraparma gracilis TaxID=2962635 RepID=A0ABQ6MCT9_9STRA|nr:hypothetical protein TeGR_g10009 [Tetraparma gracilis]